MNLPASATSYSGDVSGTLTHKSTAHTTPTGTQKTLKSDISPVVQGKKNIGAFGMLITVPTQKQGDKIFEKKREQNNITKSKTLMAHISCYIKK